MSRQPARDSGSLTAPLPPAALILFALGLGVLLILVALLQQMGVPDGALGPVVVAAPLASVIGAALLCRVRNRVGFRLGDRVLGGAAGGLALAASIAVLPGFASLGLYEFEAGFDGLWSGLGMTLGLALAAILALPLVRASAAVDLTAMTAARFGRTVAAIAALSAAALMLLAASAGLAALGQVAGFAWGTDPALGSAIAAALVLLIVLPGGARSLTAMQAPAAILMLAAVAVIAFALSWTRGGSPFPILAYGEALGAIDKLEIGLIGQKLADGATLKRHAAPFISGDALNFLGSLITTALGLAALPLLMLRAAAAPSPMSARGVAAGGLLALLPVIALLPAVAAYLRLDVLTLVAKPTPVSALPEHLIGLGQAGALKLCGVLAASQDAVASACGALPGHKGLLRLQDIRIDPALAFLAAPRLAALPAYAGAIAIAGTVAALLAMTAGAAFAAAGAMQPGLAPQAAQDVEPLPGLTVPRLLVIATVAAAAGLAVAAPADIRRLAPWIFPLSATTLLPPLLLAFWWRRATAAGVALGMLAGAALTLYYLAGTTYAPLAFYETWPDLSAAAPSAVRRLAQLKSALAAATPENKAAALAALDAHAATLANWFGLRTSAVGLIGLPVAIVVALVASLLTPAPTAPAIVLTDRARAGVAGTSAVTE